MEIGAVESVFSEKQRIPKHPISSATEMAPEMEASTARSGDFNITKKPQQSSTAATKHHAQHRLLSERDPLAIRAMLLQWAFINIKAAHAFEIRKGKVEVRISWMRQPNDVPD